MMSVSNLSSLFRLIIILIFSCTFFGCQGTGSNNPKVDAQGLFEFPSDKLSSEKSEIPNYLNEEAILCNGKGLKVAKCISNQLKKGICLGIIKHEKRVYAIEIPCESVKQNGKDTVMTVM